MLARSGWNDDYFALALVEFRRSKIRLHRSEACARCVEEKSHPKGISIQSIIFFLVDCNSHVIDPSFVSMIIMELYATFVKIVWDTEGFFITFRRKIYNSQDYLEVAILLKINHY